MEFEWKVSRSFIEGVTRLAEYYFTGNEEEQNDYYDTLARFTQVKLGGKINSLHSLLIWVTEVFSDEELYS